MSGIRPLDVMGWTLRKRPADVIRLYNTLAGVMRLATGYESLNFGLWDGLHDAPVQAQMAMAEHVGSMAGLDSCHMVADVGCGFGAPAEQWRRTYPETSIICVDINHNSLAAGVTSHGIAGSATSLPLADDSFDAVVSLESAQHFRPLTSFIQESARVLAPGGILCIAMPVVGDRYRPWSIALLHLTWSSEHYTVKHLMRAIQDASLNVEHQEMVGRSVYEPLAAYYVAHRDSLRHRIVQQYPQYIESVLYRSILEMDSASRRGAIDYIIVKCRRPNRLFATMN